MQGVTELGAYLLAIVSAFGFSSALLQKAHSRVDFLFPRMPPFLISVLNLAAAVLLFGLAAISVWQGWHVLDESLLFDSRASTPLQTPLWIPQGLWLAGLAVFAGVTFACAVHAAILFVQGPRPAERALRPALARGPDRGRDAGHAARSGQAAMISMTAVAIGFAGMIALLFLGLHVATALFLTAVLAIQIYFGGSLLSVYGTQLWSAMEDYILLSIPLYILLGEILVRSGATDKMYGAIALWLGRLPGGLLHTNVGASALFSAVSGSSVSTAATIATVALPSFRRRKYDDRLVLGSIAAGASLGNLIPPGIAFIVYASLTNTSVGQLYAAAIIPSIMMTLLFMLTIIGAALVRPDLARRARAARAAARAHRAPGRPRPARSWCSSSSWARSTPAGRR